MATRVLRLYASHLYVHRLLLCRGYAAAMKCLPARDVHDIDQYCPLGASIIAPPLRWHVCVPASDAQVQWRQAYKTARRLCV